MEHASVHKVKDVQAPVKRWLQGVVGQPLRGEEEVLVMVVPPHQVPTAAARRKAAKRMDRVFAKAERFARKQGITDKEIDEAVNEAMAHVRRRKS